MQRESIEMECEQCHQAPDDGALSPCPDEDCPSNKLMCWDCLFDHTTTHGLRDAVDYRKEAMCEVCDGVPDHDGLDTCGNDGCRDDRRMCSTCLAVHEEECRPYGGDDDDDGEEQGYP